MFMVLSCSLNAEMQYFVTTGISIQVFPMIFLPSLYKVFRHRSYKLHNTTVLFY